jgi:predicted transcriptional regulator
MRTSQGQSGPRRTQTEREEHLAITAELDKKGWNQTAIAAELGVSQRQISHDLKKLRKRYIQQQIGTREEMIAQKIEELRWVQRKAAEAFEHSQGLFLREIIEQVVDQAEEARELGREPTEFKITVKSLPENSFLNTIRQVILNQCGLMGIETEVKRSEAPPVNVNVGLQLNFWDQLSGTVNGEVDVDAVQKRLDAAIEDPQIRYGLKELPPEQPGVTIENNGDSE